MSDVYECSRCDWKGAREGLREENGVPLCPVCQRVAREGLRWTVHQDSLTTGAHMNRTLKARFEKAISDIYQGLWDYQAAHEAAYKSKLSADHVLGAEWLAMANGLLGLLNGELGGLDVGDIDDAIRCMAQDAGFDRDLENSRD